MGGGRAAGARAACPHERTAARYGCRGLGQGEGAGALRARPLAAGRAPARSIATRAKLILLVVDMHMVKLEC